jgi:hypothetical protein
MVEKAALALSDNLPRADQFRGSRGLAGADFEQLQTLMPL